MNVKWDPLKKESANFATHTLIQKDDGSLIYHSANHYKLFGLAMFLIGFIMLTLYFFKSNVPFIVLILGVAFIVAGVFVLGQSIVPSGFNKPQKVFFKGRIGKKHNLFGKANVSIPFQDIYAIQLLKKVGEVSTNSENYTDTRYFEAYELNLVGEHGDRQYVMTYTDLNQIYQDSNWISTLLNVPIWNAIEVTQFHTSVNDQDNPK